MPPHFKNTRHGLVAPQPVISMAGHGRDIMGEQDSSRLGGPFENRWIRSSLQACILHAHDINTRMPTSNASHNVVVEVLVGGKTQHVLPLAPTGQQTVLDSNGIKTS